MNILLVAFGGAAGSVLRYAVDRAVTGAFDVRAAGTFVVNVLGSFGIGLFFGLTERYGWSMEARTLIAVGFFGGFTTFSALSWQTLQLIEGRDASGAFLNVAASIVVGLLAVWAGASAGRALT